VKRLPLHEFRPTQHYFGLGASSRLHCSGEIIANCRKLRHGCARISLFFFSLLWLDTRLLAICSNLFKTKDLEASLCVTRTPMKRPIRQQRVYIAGELDILLQTFLRARQCNSAWRQIAFPFPIHGSKVRFGSNSSDLWDEGVTQGLNAIQGLVIRTFRRRALARELANGSIGVVGWADNSSKRSVFRILSRRKYPHRRG